MSTGNMLVALHLPGMSALGTWQHVVEGNANTGRVYRLPPGYATDYGLQIRRWTSHIPLAP